MITTADKLKCVERELAMRKSVYPRFVAKGSMLPEKAERELATMEAVVEDYRALLRQERAIDELQEIKHASDV